MEQKKKDEILKACKDIEDMTGIGELIVRFKDDGEILIIREPWVRNPSDMDIEIALNRVGHYGFGGVEVVDGKTVLLKKRKSIKMK